jgi:hypothetical protein
VNSAATLASTKILVAAVQSCPERSFTSVRSNPPTKETKMTTPTQTTVDKGGHGSALYRRFEVGIGKHKESRFAAQFERGAFDTASR